MMRRALIPAALLALAACSSGEGDVVTEPTASDAVATTVVDDADASADETSVVSDDTSVVSASTVEEIATTTTVAEVAPVEPILNGAMLIPTLTPVVVDVLRPVLEWEPVDGSARYSVVVLDEAGEPYWIWSGSESAITLGGAPSSDFGVGPILGVDYSWSVAAFDADGLFLAISGQVPISTE